DVWVDLVSQVLHQSVSPFSPPVGSPTQIVDLSPEPLCFLLCPPASFGFLVELLPKLIGTEADLVQRGEPAFGRRIVQSQTPTIAFEVQPEHTARQPPVQLADRMELALSQSISLQSRREIVSIRIKQEVLLHLQYVAIQLVLLSPVLVARR